MSSELFIENISYSGDLSRPGTATGTIIANNGSIFKLLPVGSNDTVLTANSAAADGTGIEWSSISLTSAGGAATLVNDGSGTSLAIKGLTAGTGIDVVDVGGTHLTISADSDSLNIWTETSAIIKPITTSTSGILCGDAATNEILGGTIRGAIVGGTTNIIQNCDDTAIMASETCTIVSTGNGFNRSAIIASDDCTVTNINNSNDCSIISGSLCTIIGSGLNRCAILGGILNEIRHSINSGGANGTVILGGSTNITDRSSASAIMASDTCNIISTGNGVNRSVIIASDDCSLSDINNSTKCSIISGDTCSITADANASNRCSIIAGQNNTITNGASNSIIIGGHDSTTGKHNTILLGCHLTSTFHSNVMLGDGNTTTMPSVAQNAYSARFSGGYRLFTNAAQTTGMTLSGAGSWSLLSDINKKENILEENYNTTLEKLKRIPIYSYNYIGCCPEERNIGPVAQDWHREFPLDEISEEEEYEELGEVKIRMTTREAKDKLRIEQGDQIGVCLAAIRGLIAKNETLEARIIALEAL